MNEENKELSAELKLKLLQVERDADKTTVPRVKILKSALAGAIFLAVLPFFGLMRFSIWQILIFSLIFGLAGGILFAFAAICRNNRK